MGTPDAGPADLGPPVPRSIFFVGNSFTIGYDIPDQVRQLATFSGYPEPKIGRRTVGGRSLADHRAETSDVGAPALIPRPGGWDALVLQEYSTRPTDSVGPAAQFKIDATWFYDLAKSVNPDTDVVLYETWARRYNHAFYPNIFMDPTDMQAQLRFHYEDAAMRAIPMMSTSTRTMDARLARAGDAWEMQLAGGENPRLHASDDYHQNAAGAYLNALMLFGTLYRSQVSGALPIGVSTSVAMQLQQTVDAITGYTHVPPGPMQGMPLAVGDGVAVDVGPTTVGGWAALSAISSSTGPLVRTASVATRIWVNADGFTGTQTGGAARNDLGLPTDVARDSLWVGSTGGREEALTRTATVTFNGLDAGSYRLRLFASRAGDDGARRRMGAYTVGASTLELDASDNVARTLVFEDVRPDASGQLRLEIRVSPTGSSRFAYLGVLWLERTGS